MAFLKEEVKAGIIVVSSLLILSAFVILIGGSEFFKKPDHYFVKVMNSAGIEPGAQVRLGGVRVGRVLTVNPPQSPGEPVTIDLGLQKGTALYRGTKAAITQVGLVGDMYVLLAIDQTTGDRIPVGEVIPSAEQIPFDVLMAKLNTLSDSVSALVRDVNKLFAQDNVDEVGRILKNANAAIQSASGDITQVAAAVKGTAGKAQAALSAIEKTAATVDGTAATASKAIDRQSQNLDLLLARARESFERAAVTLDAIEKAAAAIDGTAETAARVIDHQSQNVDLLLARVRESFEKASTTLQAVEKAAASIDGTFTNAGKVVDHQSQNLDVLLTSLTRASEDLREVLHELKTKPWGVIYPEGREKGE